MDLPVKGASDNDQEIFEGAALALKDKYSNMFKESQNAMRPHVNIDRLRNQLYQVPACSIPRTRTDTHGYAHTHTYIHTYIHTNMHTYIHTHTHTQVESICSRFPTQPSAITG